MRYRTLGKSGLSLSTISFGAWATGGDFGAVSDEDSLSAMRRAVELGVNFIDTADVYGDGRSERVVGRLRREVGDSLVVATKAGRRLQPHVASGYDGANLRAFVERSLQNLGVEALDLLQLHCPPTDVYYAPEVFGALDRLVEQGLVRHYGVSVERVEEGLKALEYPGVVSVQIIYNVFRTRPAELFFAQALEKNVGVLARVPLASGLLSGSMRATRRFEDADHRKYNRQGEAFDRGETFSGVDYELGLELVESVRRILDVPSGNLAPWALRFILMQEAVTCAIPGGKSPDQVETNCGAAELPPLSVAQMRALSELYTEKLRPLVHQRW